MTTARPNVFIININPHNWEECLEDHIFGLREGASHPKFSKGDIFLVRRTGKDYGVMGIWSFSYEEYVTDQSQVPWTDAEYPWQLFYQPLVDFQTPMSEEFSGASKFSQKLQFTVQTIRGAVKLLETEQINKYIESILNEKAADCSVEVEYRGQKRQLTDVLRGIIAPIPQETKREIREVSRGIAVPVSQEKEQKQLVHSELQKGLRALGEKRGFAAEQERPCNHFRIDVVWQKPLSKTPDFCFEICISGDPYKDLLSLKHAKDIWKSKTILIAKEEVLDRASELVSGALHELEDVQLWEAGEFSQYLAFADRFHKFENYLR